jgi:hypothetical protein
VEKTNAFRIQPGLDASINVAVSVRTPTENNFQIGKRLEIETVRGNALVEKGKTTLIAGFASKADPQIESAECSTT